MLKGSALACAKSSTWKCLPCLSTSCWSISLPGALSCWRGASPRARPCFYVSTRPTERGGAGASPLTDTHSEWLTNIQVGTTCHTACDSNIRHMAYPPFEIEKLHPPPNLAKSPSSLLDFETWLSVDAAYMPVVLIQQLGDSWWIRLRLFLSPNICWVVLLAVAIILSPQKIIWPPIRKSWSSSKCSIGHTVPQTCDYLATYEVNSLYSWPIRWEYYFWWEGSTLCQVINGIKEEHNLLLLGWETRIAVVKQHLFEINSCLSKDAAARQPCGKHPHFILNLFRRISSIM